MNNIYICFPEGKFKVLTFSYDDGKVEDRKLVELFNKYNLKGTFNLNGGITSDNDRIPISEYKELYKGHEVACHTFTHPTIERCPIEEVAVQLIEDRKVLEKATDGYVRGLAYPNGSTSDDIEKLLPMVGVKYGRTVHSTGNFSIPRDFAKWNPTCHHKRDLIQRGKEFADLHKSQYLYMLYVWGHSYEFTTDNNWNVMEEFCEMISNKDDIWYATNIQIVDYLTKARQLQYSIDFSRVYNPFAISIWINFNGEIVEIKGGEDKKLQ